jgi:hypothetical protein
VFNVAKVSSINVNEFGMELAVLLVVIEYVSD